MNGNFYAMKQSILIVEENIAIRFLLTTVLQKQYKVTGSNDCYAAINELKNKDIDLIILNIDSMDSVNLEFLGHINSSSLYSGIPVIVLSKSNDIKLKSTCLDMGVVYYFEKPFDPRVLVDNVDSALLTPIPIYGNVNAIVRHDAMAIKATFQANPS